MRGWRRTFWVVFFANLISGVGISSFLPFFPSLLEELGLEDEHARAVWSGVLFGAAPLSAAFMGPVWGSVGDRYGRKLMVVRALLGLALFAGAMTWARSAWELLLLRIGQGVFSAYIPPSLTLVSISVPRELQGRVTSWVQAASTVGTIAGPLCGALLLASLGRTGVFVSVAASAGLGALLVALFAHEDREKLASPAPLALEGLLRATWGDLATLLALPGLRAGLLVYAAVHLAFGATSPLLELFVEQLSGSPRVEGLTGTLFSSVALASILATPLWGRWGDLAGHERALRLSALLSALTLALHALVPGYAWLLLARSAFGLASPGASTAAFGVAATESALDKRGAAMGAMFSARAFAVSLGSLTGGALAALLGMRGLFVAAGGLIALSLLVRRR
jgi:MFS family permease